MAAVFDLWLLVPVRVVSCRNFSHITDVISFRIYTFGCPLQLYSHYFHVSHFLRLAFSTVSHFHVSHFQSPHIDKWYSKYSDLYEHYVNSVKLVANNRLSIIDNMLSYVV